MAAFENTKEQLLEKFDLLLKRQDYLAREIEKLKAELDNFGASERPSDADVELARTRTEKQAVEQGDESLVKKTFVSSQEREKVKKPPLLTNKGLDLEKWIGENIISKIGIAITVIGVAIGAKYSIDKELISPIARIILGYLFGVGLLGLGMQLKTTYSNFSAVLVSGAIAILYFITFAAFDFYNLFPQAVAFALMVVFTGFAVFAALHYNQQVIALLGFVGAYAVPFLLSNGSGNAEVLFGYMAIINAGILVVALKKYWKHLLSAAFVFTWCIFSSWYFFRFDVAVHFAMGFLFATLFFVLFYGTFLGYKIIKRETLAKGEVVLVLANAFIYFSLGYAMLQYHPIGKELLGVFAFGNALIHFVMAVVVQRTSPGNASILHLLIVFSLTFLAIAIPVQLDGNWVTLLWAVQAALLFWLGRSKGVGLYEKIALPLMVFAFLSLVQDWDAWYSLYLSDYSTKAQVLPVFNIYFFTALFVIAAFGFALWLQVNQRFSTALRPNDKGFILSKFLIPSLVFLTAYLSVRVEIINYFNQLYLSSKIAITATDDLSIKHIYNSEILQLKAIWLSNYNLVFVSLLSISFTKWWRTEKWLPLLAGISALAIGIFLTEGLLALSNLQQNNFSPPHNSYYSKPPFYSGLRYLSIILVAISLYTGNLAIRQKFQQPNWRLSFDAVLWGTGLWLLSSELLNGFVSSASQQSYKLGLSILWGVYALAVVVVGIWKRKPYFRYWGMGLFAVTLLKLFFYDITHLDTIAKTIVFVVLGVLLLVISFFYNKFKDRLLTAGEAPSISNKEPHEP